MSKLSKFDKKPFFFLIFLLFILLLILWLFQNENKIRNKSEYQNSTLSLDSASEIIKVGTSITEPFTYYSSDNQLIGYDIDLINYIADDNNLKIELIEMPFANLIPSLRSEKVDIIISAIHIRKEREEVIDFSSPYLTTGLVFVSKEEINREINTINDLDGLSIGVKIGATGYDVAKFIENQGIEINIIEYKDTLTSFLDIGVGRVDVILNDYLNSKYMIDHSFNNYEIITDENGENLFYYEVGLGIAVRTEENDLLNRINASLTNWTTQKDEQLEYNNWFDNKLE